ncbi:MAG TPA: type II secretion system F family protein [Dehalococcoidales bacterium]|nr:type II secretion system F family protein [Dehalococcoidales bacterium]
MVYQYVAYNENGEVVRGKLPASNEEAATDLLGYAGYKAISLKAQVPFLNLDKLLVNLFRVKPSEIILFYRQLAILLESGTDIVASLELLQDQTANHTLKRVLGEVISDLRRGNQLSIALGKHPQVFSSIYCRLLSVGEQSGDLETVLKQVADYMEKEIANAKETKSALMYPAITSVVTIVVIGLLVTFVLPSFGNLYSTLGVDLPPLARALISLAGTIQSYWTYLLLAILTVVGLALIYLKTPGGQYKRDNLILRLPILGRVIHLSELARSCRSMSLLLRAGLPLTEAMPLVVQSGNNKVMAKAISYVQQDMIKGEGLSRPMAKNKIFLPLMVQMVRVGEETGNLDITLLSVALSYEAEAEDKTRTLIALIQPAMTLIIGLIIGLVAVTLTSAMYSLYGGF